MTTESSRAGPRRWGGLDITVSVTDAAHLLRRTGFGVTAARLAEITPLADRAAAVARVTDLSLAPPATGAPIGGGWVEDQWEAWYQLCWWWMERMRTSPVPLVEKMVLFWHNHFVSGQDKLYDMGLLYTQNQLFRQHALGDYHALVQGMAIDPAMLWYLDNAENVAGREQENFAREVMELFTMGQGNYTEADVITMARAWTGHNVSDDRRSYQFRSSRHDNGTKVLFGGPPTNWDGPATLTEILRGQPRRPRVAVHHRQALLVPRLPGAGHRSPGGDARRRVPGQQPVDPVARASDPRRRRPSGARPPATRSCATPPSGSWPAWRPSGSRPASAIPSGGWRAPGQQLFYPPNVAGWKQNSYWISTASGWARIGLGLLRPLAGQRRRGVRRHPEPVGRGDRHRRRSSASASSTPPPPPAPPSRHG